MNKHMRQLYATLADLETRSENLRSAASPEKPKGLRVSAVSGDLTEMYVYGEIGGGWWGGVNAADFSAELRNVSTPNLHVRISSVGGDVFEAVAMHTALRRWSGTVTTFNDALAASAASFLAMAGDRIVTEQGAMWMLHAASTMTHGTAADHRESAELLDKVTAVIAEFYALRAGGETAEWLDLLNSGDNWYTAAEALDLGITDEIVTDQPEAKVNARLRYLSARLRNAPEIERVGDEVVVSEEIFGETTIIEDVPVETEDAPLADQADDVAGSPTENDSDFAFAMSMMMALR